MYAERIRRRGAFSACGHSHDEIAHGATLTDHYGKREHDIDPEHDV
ncbi:MAG: hypothetical protein IPQ15_02590 [Betaproteobacteria bacterium]|nr:hypothetical protein [Betaproteobacteria bacterium]